MELSEKEVLKECLNYLEIMGIYHWRNNTGAVKSGSRFIRYGFKGSADILGICPDGRFLAIECKREVGGILSPEQIVFLTKIKENGGVTIVANSLDTLIKELAAQNVI